MWPLRTVYIVMTVSSQCLLFTLLSQLKLVYGLFGQSNMHSTLNICPRTARKETNVPLHTGKSFSEALILASTNPQYDKRLFIELRVQYMKIASSEHVVYKNCFFCFCFDIQNNVSMYTTCSVGVLSLQFSCTELVNQLTIFCLIVGQLMQE